MIIEIIDVSQPTATKTAKGQYQTIEVSYKNEQGQVQGKKLMSFSNPSVFKAVQGYVKGDRLDVETTKDEQGYWQWKAINKEGEAPARAAAPASGGGGKVVGSNYETAEERAKKQVYIVRQSSISSAIELLGQGKSVDDVLSTAKAFESYVFDTTA